MNDMTVPTAQDFFTAAELADLAKRLGFEGLPHTKRGVQKRIDRSGWNDQPASLVRRRGGAQGGGGLEYHISLIPQLQSMVMRARMLKSDVSNRNAMAVRGEVAIAEKQDIASDPTQEAIKTGKARAQIIMAIIGYASRHHLSTGKAIAAFLAAQDAYGFRQDVFAARDAGEFLTPDQLLAIQEEPLLTRRDGFWISEEVIETANGRARMGADRTEVSRRSLYRWLKTYQAGGSSALVPQPTKAEKPIPDEFWRFMRFYARPAKPRATVAHADYLASVRASGDRLTLNQVTYILREKLDHIEKNKGREGPLTLRARMAYVSRDTSDLFPTSIYTADGKTFDAEIADHVSRGPMRPELTSILDVATKFCVGWAVSRKENVIAVTEALRNSCVYYGVPALFYVDRGAGYKNKRFDDDGNGLMARLSIQKMHALPYGSQAKGVIERSHQSIWDPLAKSMPTYLGADMDKEARQRAYKQSRAEMKEFGWSKLLMPWDEFHAACQEAVDRYNDAPSTSLPKFVDPATGRIRHMSPREAWESHVQKGFEPVLIDQDDVDDLFRPYEKRKVERCIINLWTNEYFSLDLNPYHGEWVFVGYDDAQADKVWVREIDARTREPGRLICVAIYGGNRVSYVPRSMQQQAEERRLQGQLKRLDEKRRAKEAQVEAPYLIEHRDDEVADFIDMVPPEPAEPASVESNVTEFPEQQAARPKRRTFASDEELAAWALQHPDELKPNQIAVLRDCMSNATARKLFEMSGIDLEALRTLLRAVA